MKGQKKLAIVQNEYPPHSPKCNYISCWYPSILMYHMNQVKKLVSTKDQ